MRRRLVQLLLGVGLGACLGACADDSPDDTNAGMAFDRETLLDPTSCRGCHPGQYDEWAGSMHAYSSEDPVFIAMNARGQEETDGKLGTFCLNCHAPMAVRENKTEDGSNLDELPAAYRGVTCYFCHNVESIEGVHNNPLVLANDRVMRGAFDDPADNPAHPSAYSPHFDPARAESSELCGTCHDVTLTEQLVGYELKLERTYAEWQDSFFAKPADEGGASCNGCHMPGSPERDQAASGDDAPPRRSARHDFEGVDLAITEFPGKERQRVLVERFLASSLLAEICVAETGAIEVTLENAGSGHNWPSGASHDRAAWLEVRAYVDGEDNPVFETVAPESENDDAERIVLKDHVVDADGEEAHMFWDVAEIESTTTLPSVLTRDPLDPEFHRERRIWTFNTQQAGAQALTRVDLTVRLRPIGLPILEDLVSTGHLDAQFVEAMPVIDVLPERCYDEDVLDRFADLIARGSGCDPEISEATLVWRDTEANEDNRKFRISRVNDVPARCLSHPTYVSVPQSE